MPTTKLNPTILIMVGITGDLSRRYLLPAITHLADAGELPDTFKLIGVSRRDVTTSEVLKDIEDTHFLNDHLEMRKMDLDSAEDFKDLASYLDKLQAEMGEQVQRIFYLSVPPSVSSPIITLLGQVGLAKTGTTKLMLEKPFGIDLASARELVTHINGHFEEDQIYRIDHYVAKEMAQSLVLMRQENPWLERIWSSDCVERIEIVASEEIGIEGRATFYEETGALRDLVQSHLLQLMALTTMEVQGPLSGDELRAARLKALKALRLSESDAAVSVHRGQYAGYLDEVKNDSSTTETFVELNLTSSSDLWGGVELRITTGKSLNEKATTINLILRGEKAGTLTVRIQPEAAIELGIKLKAPGYDNSIFERNLSYTYSDEHDGSQIEAYERVFLDAIRTDHHLFVSSEEVLASWELLGPVQSSWKGNNEGMITYAVGSRPEEVVPGDA
jgi:glucose-6-phosphate 1-dehydrogenase